MRTHNFIRGFLFVFLLCISVMFVVCASMGCKASVVDTSTVSTEETVIDQEVEEGGAAATALTTIEAPKTNGWDVLERLTKWILGWLTVVIFGVMFAKGWLDGNLDFRKPNTGKGCQEQAGASF